MKASYNDITSLKSFVHQMGGRRVGLSVNKEEGDPNDGYVVAVKTNATKTVQIKCNNDFSSFQFKSSLLF